MATEENVPIRRPEYLKALTEVLTDHVDGISSRDAMREVERRVQPSTYEAQRLEKTGYVRWWSALQLDSIRLVKAGWLRKRRGVWSGRS